MWLKTSIDEETKEINFGTLLFNSGKKIILDADETKEVLCKFDAKYREGEINVEDINTLTDNKEFYITGAYAKGIKHNDKMLLVITQIEEDTFCDGDECNDRIVEEYGL